MLKKRSFTLSGHRTSVALEAEFWDVLENMAQAQNLSLAALVSTLDQNRGERALASTCRLAVLKHLKSI